MKGKLLAKTARLGVIGLGYVGLPLAVEKAKACCRTKGFDINSDRSGYGERGSELYRRRSERRLKGHCGVRHAGATTDFSEVAGADCVCVCVPTPLDSHQQPDISYVRASAESIVPYMHRDMLVVLESTTYPGTTEELLRPYWSRRG